MINVKTFRNRSMKKAYAFAREGNAHWAQMWIDQANSYFPVHPNQLAHANKLLRAARSK